MQAVKSLIRSRPVFPSAFPNSSRSLAASRRALELAPSDEKEKYQGYLDRLRGMIDEARTAESGKGDGR